METPIRVRLNRTHNPAATPTAHPTVMSCSYVRLTLSTSTWSLLNQEGRFRTTLWFQMVLVRP